VLQEFKIHIWRTITPLPKLSIIHSNATHLASNKPGFLLSRHAYLKKQYKLFIPGWLLLNTVWNISEGSHALSREVYGRMVLNSINLSYNKPARDRFNVPQLNTKTCGVKKIFMYVNNVTQCSMTKNLNKKVVSSHVMMMMMMMWS
jgi:hypothetical protein